MGRGSQGEREGTLSYLWHQVRNLKTVMNEKVRILITCCGSCCSLAIFKDPSLKGMPASIWNSLVLKSPTIGETLEHSAKWRVSVSVHLVRSSWKLDRRSDRADRIYRLLQRCSTNFASSVNSADLWIRSEGKDGSAPNLYKFSTRKIP